MTPYALVTALAVAGLLASERTGRRAGTWIFKPVASTGFLAAALAAGALQTGYGQLILAGLVLSWLGDVLLIPRHSPAVFRAGVLSFLLGHVAFATAFVARGVDGAWALAALAGASLVLVGIVRWLSGHLPPDMRVAAYAYMVVISVMVVAAVGTFGARSDFAIVAGALAFYLSDLSVARDRFVASQFFNRLWGLPLYYGAQLLLAFSTSSAHGLPG
jgi:uncharacterized membrane protein YhhN